MAGRTMQVPFSVTTNGREVNGFPGAVFAVSLWELCSAVIHSKGINSGNKKRFRRSNGVRSSPLAETTILAVSLVFTRARERGDVKLRALQRSTLPRGFCPVGRSRKTVSRHYFGADPDVSNVVLNHFDLLAVSCHEE